MQCSVWNLSSYVGYVESSSLSWTMKRQAWKKFMMDREIYVWQSCVEIECKTTWLRPDLQRIYCATRRVIPSHLQCLVQSAVSLNFRSSFLSPQGLSSAFTGTFPLWNSLSFTSSLNSVPSTTSLPSLSRSFVPKSLWAAARRNLSLVSGPSPIFCDFLFLH